MRGDLVCFLVDVEAFEIQMRAIAFDTIANAKGRRIGHPMVLWLEGTGCLPEAPDLVFPGVCLPAGGEDRIIGEQGQHQVQILGGACFVEGDFDLVKLHEVFRISSVVAPAIIAANKPAATASTRSERRMVSFQIWGWTTTRHPRSVWGRIARAVRPVNPRQIDLTPA